MAYRSELKLHSFRLVKMLHKTDLNLYKIWKIVKEKRKLILYKGSLQKKTLKSLEIGKFPNFLGFFFVGFPKPID